MLYMCVYILFLLFLKNFKLLLNYSCLHFLPTALCICVLNVIYIVYNKYTYLCTGWVKIRLYTRGVCCCCFSQWSTQSALAGCFCSSGRFSECHRWLYVYTFFNKPTSNMKLPYKKILLILD